MKQANSLRMSNALLLENPRCQAISGVVLFDRTASLHDNRPAVIFVCAEMDRAAAYLAAGLQHRLVNVMSPHTLASETRQ